MLHIRNRNDLIKLVEDNPPRGAIGTAIVTGTVELLGAFDKMVPSIHAGWVLRITSESGQNTYLVAITHTKYMPDWKIYEIENIPWDHWIGEEVPSGLAKGDLDTYEECVCEHRKALEHETGIQRILEDRRPLGNNLQINRTESDESNSL
jgi:hypothetical protein